MTRTLPLLPATALVAVSLLACAASAQPSSPPPPVPPGAHPHAASYLRTVTVGGEGEASARPDRARIRLGVQTQAPTAAEAMRANSVRMDALVKTLRDAGIPDEAIQTQNLSLWPEHSGGDRPGETPRVVGYRASNTVEARVDEIDSVGGVLDRAIAAGGNTLEGISFELSDPKPVLDRARESAMADARRKAEQLARLAGVALGPVVAIDETGGAAPPPMPYAKRAMEMSMAAQDVSVSPGEQRVVARVNVSWELAAR